MSSADEGKMVPARAAQEASLVTRDRLVLGMTPGNFTEAVEMAKLLSAANMIPKDYAGNPGNILIGMQMGAELGLAPLQALQSICVINGKPSVWGDALLALIIKSGLMDGQPIETLENGVATCTVKRRDWDKPTVRTFSIDDAKKARLWSKAGPWQDYPERMLQMRARAFALRDTFPDVLRGLAIAEEVRDQPVAPGAAGPALEAQTVKADPVAAMRSELGTDDQTWELIQSAWDNQEVPLSQRIVHSKRFAGRAQKLLEHLVPSVKKMSTRTRRKFERTQEEANPPAGAVAVAVGRDEAGIRESIDAALGSDSLGTFEPDPSTVCEHGVDMNDPCDQCTALADELDAKAAAEAAALEKPVEVQETAAQYAARRKEELRKLNEGSK